MTEFLDVERQEIAAVKGAVAMPFFIAWFKASAAKQRYKKARMADQNFRCCYCQRFFETDNNLIWDLEHVLYEDHYPQFAAESGNLVMACKDCNSAKRDQDVYRPRGRSGSQLHTLPKRSASYSRPHPKLDAWNDYLAHINFQIYRAKSEAGEKGAELIKVCQLNRRATERGGLNYDSVVVAIRNGLFQNPVLAPMIEKLPDAQILEFAAITTAALEQIRIEALKVQSTHVLTRLERNARRRKVTDAVNAAKRLVMEADAAALADLNLSLLYNAAADAGGLKQLPPPHPANGQDNEVDGG